MTEPVRITLLSQENCGFCDHAKQVLARIGEEYAVQVTEIDLATATGRHLAAASGVLFAPGVLVDDEPFSYGRLSERKLRRALRDRAASRRNPTAPPTS